MRVGGGVRIHVGHSTWRSSWAVAALMAEQRGSEATGSHPAVSLHPRPLRQRKQTLPCAQASHGNILIVSKVGIMLREREGGCEGGHPVSTRSACKRLAGHSLQSRVPSASCLFLSIHLPRQSTDCFEILLVNRSNHRQHGRCI